MGTSSREYLILVIGAGCISATSSDPTAVTLTSCSTDDVEYRAGGDHYEFSDIKSDCIVHKQTSLQGLIAGSAGKSMYREPAQPRIVRKGRWSKKTKNRVSPRRGSLYLPSWPENESREQPMVDGEGLNELTY